MCSRSPVLCPTQHHGWGHTLSCPSRRGDVAPWAPVLCVYGQSPGGWETWLSVARLTGLPGKLRAALGFLRDMFPAVLAERPALATHVLTLDSEDSAWLLCKDYSKIYGAVINEAFQMPFLCTPAALASPNHTFFSLATCCCALFSNRLNKLENELNKSSYNLLIGDPKTASH